MKTKRLESVDHALSVAEKLGYSREAGQAAIDNMLEHIGGVMFTDEDDGRAETNYDLFIALASNAG